MRRSYRFLLLVCQFAIAFGAPIHAAQSPTAGTAVSSVPLYPDSPAGLERLMRDYMKLLHSGETAKTNDYLQSLILSDPAGWYSFVFGDFVGGIYKTAYLAHHDSELHLLEQDIQDAMRDGFKDVRVIKYENSCKTYIVATRYPVLRAEQNPFPLYEVNFLKTPTSFRTVWAFAYVNKGFRFVGPLAPPRRFPTSVDSSNTPVPRVNVDAKTQASRLLSQDSPPFPAAAKNSSMGFLWIEATLHVLIGTDGSVKEAVVTQGDCFFSDPAILAVKKWRYTPAVVEGKAVEVETDVHIRVSR